MRAVVVESMLIQRILSASHGRGRSDATFRSRTARGPDLTNQPMETDTARPMPSPGIQVSAKITTIVRMFMLRTSYPLQ
jgi:hypothetical protein